MVSVARANTTAMCGAIDHRLYHWNSTICSLGQKSPLSTYWL